MKIFKKFLSSMVMAATLTSAVTITPSLGAMAVNVSILPGDVNYDNVVNVRDIAWISSYLEGDRNANANNVTRADANCDGIIDYQDYNTILDYVSNNEQPNTYTAELYDNLDNTERSYYKFFYSNGASTGRCSYVLQTSNTNLQSIESINENFADTEFIRDYSNIGVVRVGNGSGFIVGDHLVLTAAHCVCGGTKSNPTAFLDLDVTVYNNNETVSKVYDIDSIHVPQGYYDYGEVRDYNYDYALVHIDSHYDNIPIRTFSQYAPFKIGYMTSKFVEDGGPIITSGFTVDPNSSNAGNHRYYSTGNIDSETTNLRYHADANANNGDSGGLAYYNSIYDNELIKSAVGNITGGGIGANYTTWGVRITPTVARFCFRNNHI